MAETTTTRLGLRRWSADTDTWGRAEFDANNAARELLVAAFTQGGATRPTPNMGGRFYYDSTTDSISYDTAARWVTVQRQTQAVATIVQSGTVYDTGTETGAPAGTPNVFRRGDLVTVVVAINRPVGATLTTAPLLNIPAGFRPSRPIPFELFSRPDRNGSSATIATDGNLTATRSFGSGEFIYGSVTYPAP